jgi:hypothetical protein
MLNLLWQALLLWQLVFLHLPLPSSDLRKAVKTGRTPVCGSRVPSCLISTKQDAVLTLTGNNPSSLQSGLSHR